LRMLKKEVNSSPHNKIYKIWQTFMNLL
jgi:hypothetical protein